MWSRMLISELHCMTFDICCVYVIYIKCIENAYYFEKETVLHKRQRHAVHKYYLYISKLNPLRGFFPLFSEDY